MFLQCDFRWRHYLWIESAYRQGKIDFINPFPAIYIPLGVSCNDIMGFGSLNYDEWSICIAACHRGSTEKIPLFVFFKRCHHRPRVLIFMKSCAYCLFKLSYR